VILRHFDQKVTSSSFHLIRQQRFNKEETEVSQAPHHG